MNCASVIFLCRRLICQLSIKSSGNDIFNGKGFYPLRLFEVPIYHKMGCEILDSSYMADEDKVI